jgi:hypothetical protein
LAHGIGTHRQAGEGVAEQLGQQEQGRAGLAGLALAADLQSGLIEHGRHLGFEQGQGLGDIGGTEHRALKFLELLVEIGVAGGAGHGLAEDLEFGLGALDAGGLGVVDRATGLLAGDGLQGEKQQEAEGGCHGQLGAEAGAAFQQRIMGPQLGGDLQQGQAEQGGRRRY